MEQSQELQEGLSTPESEPEITSSSPNNAETEVGKVFPSSRGRALKPRKIDNDSSSKRSALQVIDELDKSISLRVHGAADDVAPRWILRVLEYSGDGLFWIPVTAALWLAPAFLDKMELRSFLFNLFVAFLFDLLVIGVLKGLIRRPRPIYNKGMHLVVSVDHYSFPSGHSSRAILIAAFLWLHLPALRSLFPPNLLQDFHHLAQKSRQHYGSFTPVVLLPLLPPFPMRFAAPVFLWAISTAVSRILLGRHYVSDVVVGSILGLVEALFVHRMLHVPSDVSRALHGLILGVFQRS